MAHRILLAEDTPANVLMFKTVLQAAGYVIDVAGDGVTAAQMGSDPSYALILMDLGLPGIDGLEAAQRIIQSGQQAPIIALTAEDGHEIEKACRAAGMKGFLMKPISPKELVRAVGAYLAQTS